MINGFKGSMLEGGSRVPFIVSWPAATPAGKVRDDIVSFADCGPTFAELADAKLPDKVKYDGQSLAAQFRGQPGSPRAWAYVQLGKRWYVREPAFKLNEAGQLFDMSDAPFVEKLIDPATDIDASKAARQRLGAALTELNPAGGKTDGEDGGGKRQARRNLTGAKGAALPAGPLKAGDVLQGEKAPRVANAGLDISAEIDAGSADGVIVSQGGGAEGYAIYLKGGKLSFCIRENGELTTIAAKDPLGAGHFAVDATIGKNGALALQVDGKQVAEGKAAGPIPRQPRAGLVVGKAGRGAVGEYAATDAFSGAISNVRIKALEEK
jgi:hypothetical protein